MPQMFPMSFSMLMILVSSLVLLSATRLYWHSVNTHWKSNLTWSSNSSRFKQTW